MLTCGQKMCLIVLPQCGCVYLGLRCAISVWIASWSWTNSLEWDGVWWSESCSGCNSRSLHLGSWVSLNGYFSWTWPKRSLFRWSSLFICIFFFGTRSNEILFSCDTLSHGALSHCYCIRSVVRTCTFICQISRLSRIWGGILAPAVSAPVLAVLRLLVQVSGCWCARRLSERLDWKIFPAYLDCDLAFWYSAKLSLRSHISTLQLVFLHFISLGVWALLSVPVPCTCKQHALVYVAQYFLVKWLKQGLPAEGLVCVPSRTNFFLLLSSFRNSKRKTVVCCSFFVSV